MKVCIAPVNFKGITKPYKNKEGYFVIPISVNPTQEDIDKAISATTKNESHNGLNGRAYFYGEDLVVKKYMSREEACNFSQDREINALDLMYENGIKNDNIQEGKFAFRDANGGIYLVSTKVDGNGIIPKTNDLNEKNLMQLMGLFAYLDTPIHFSDSEYSDYKSKHGHNPIFPYRIPMHFDLSNSNIRINENKSGLIDFEYLELYDCAYLYESMNYTKQLETICDISDIPGITSNVRGFEYRTLIDYVLKLDKSDRKTFYINYLKIKSHYHELMSANYKKLYNHNSKSINNDEKMELLNISQRHKIHAKLLKNPSDDIIKAEAMKIQISNFIYTQSPFSRKSENKININEILLYLNNANRFFDEMCNNASNENEKIYWEDCIKLGKMFNNVINWIAYQIKFDYVKNPAEQELFISKLTNEHIETLDESVC